MPSPLSIFIADYYDYLITSAVAIAIMIVLTVIARPYSNKRTAFIAWLLLLISIPVAILDQWIVVQKIISTHRTMLETIAKSTKISIVALQLHETFDTNAASEVRKEKFKALSLLIEDWTKKNDSINNMYFIKESGGKVYRCDKAGRLNNGAVPIWEELSPNKILQGLIERAETNEAPAFEVDPYGQNRLIWLVSIASIDNERIFVCIEFAVTDWSKLVPMVRFGTYMFFVLFLIFFFLFQLMGIQRRISIYKIFNEKIPKSELELQQLLAKKTEKDKSSAEKNLLLQNFDTEFRRSILPVLESSYMFLRMFDNKDKTELDNDISKNPVNPTHIESVAAFATKFGQKLDDVSTLIDIKWNRLELESSVFSPQQIFNDFRNNCQFRCFENSELSISIDIREPIPMVVVGDFVNIQRVLNLIVDYAVNNLESKIIWVQFSMTETVLRVELSDVNRTTYIHERDAETPLMMRHTSNAAKNIESKPEFDFERLFMVELVKAMKGTISLQTVSGGERKCELVIPINMPDDRTQL
ncbi:MAG: hypothetical protein LBU65_05675 [Planctomycetaceae bacterium]|jgi:hypothetical protein|nr:hypothetical protein [Planctomycetaceae bacterium]